MDSRSILGRTFDVTTYQDLRTFDTCFDLVFGWSCLDRWWISHGPLPNKFKLKPPLPIDLPRDFKGPSPAKSCWPVLTPIAWTNKLLGKSLGKITWVGRQPDQRHFGRPMPFFSSAWLKILAPNSGRFLTFSRYFKVFQSQMGRKWQKPSRGISTSNSFSRRPLSHQDGASPSRASGRRPNCPERPSPKVKPWPLGIFDDLWGLNWKQTPVKTW